MAILLSDIRISMEQPPEQALVKAQALLGGYRRQICESHLHKVSIDARRRGHIQLVCSVAIEMEDSHAEKAAVEELGRRGISARLRQRQELVFTPGSVPLSGRPVIIGFGPAGMFAGLILAQNGYRPLILERGDQVKNRVKAVEGFWKTGELDSATNVQFGEGGAGTFSDGKLTTRINDPRCEYVLRELVRFGAPKQILHRAKPHIGTDQLRGVVREIRREIERLGGEIRFLTPMTQLLLRDGRVCAVKTPQGEVPAQAVILAIGHSARDTFSMLIEKGLPLEPKPFSVGVRIEHLQSRVDESLFGAYAGHPALGKGEYQLSQRRGEDAVYTFCMCPGGLVVPSSSEPGGTVTNGMSEFARDGKNANAALVVSVSPKDFGTHPMDGFQFQRQLERRAFAMAGGDYRAPVQTAGLFLAGKPGAELGRVEPTYARGCVPGDFSGLFPDKVTQMLQEGLRGFALKMRCFGDKDAVLTGPETRTSSPVRLLRGEDCQALGARGLYPAGEGAGYAGGIMSAAVDGIRVAQALIAQFAPGAQDG